MANSGKGYIPGRFIVKFNSDIAAGQVRQALSATMSMEPLYPTPMRAAATAGNEWGRYFIVTADSGATVEAIRTEIGDGLIAYVEQDQYLEFSDWPTDPLLSNQWYLVNEGQEYFGIARIDGYFNDQLVMKSGDPDADIKIRAIYENPPSDTHDVVVGVIDTGTDPLHPELAGRLWQNPGEIAGNGADDDHNGFVDDTIGWDMSGDTSRFIDIVGDNDITDIHGHGTHIAGIVASNADGVGIVGVAPWSKVMTVKIRPNAFLSIGTAGLLYAINNGANVVNISWGTPFQALVLEDALRYARQSDVFVAIAAGNSGDSTRANPAAIDSAFAVGAGNSRGYMTWFSTWGPFVDIVAPGEDILSLRATGTDMYGSEAGEPGVRIIGPDSLYYLSDGTSMAAPVAAGAAALLKSIRPDLAVGQIEDLLRLGADDLTDPLERGDTLIGPDSVCGYGYLNIAQSLALVTHGSITFSSPLQMQRYFGAVEIRALPLAGYSGNWTLEYSYGLLSENWQTLASGSSPMSDSVLFLFDEPSMNGWINLRLSDDFGHQSIRRFLYVNEDSLTLLSPRMGDTLRYSIAVRGSVYGPTFDSLRVSYRSTGSEQLLFHGSQEYFDSVITNWNASGLKSGNYTLYFRGYFEDSTRVDSARIYVASSFAAGWPQAQPSRGAASVVIADLEHDGVNELIATSAYGLFVFEANGVLKPGFPVLTDKDMRCMPAVYDVDQDGVDEIITLNPEGVHVFNPDGSYASGWPRLMETGVSTLFGAPTPSVVNLMEGQPPVIMFVDGLGEVKAYRLNGEPYFFSLGGIFTTFPPHPTPVYFFAGNSVSTADLDGDGTIEVIVNYCGLDPWAGVAIYEGRTGRPAFRQTSALSVFGMLTYGMVLSDLTGDSLPEVIVVGQNETFQRTIWVKTRSATCGLKDLPGFPIVMPEYNGWIGNYPTVADLDLDGIPEIICTFYEFDICALVIFKANGQPYVTVEGHPEGEAFRGAATLSNPIAANLVGDEHPEIVARGGYILPGTGNETIYLFDFTGALVPGYPIVTPANKRVVISDNFSPLIDDIDSDGLVELAMAGDGSEIYVWDYEASAESGDNQSRLFRDSRNRNIFPGASVATDVEEEEPNLPAAWRLDQNYPNPFNPTTTISFDIPRQSRVRLTVYNLLGQEVRVLADRVMAPGRQEIEFDGSSLATGLYLYRLEGDGFVATRKMVLLK
ncbi:MAG: S8 family peptidase [bacterium]|nr:S8 family peptidase [bacterium]